MLPAVYWSQVDPFFSVSKSIKLTRFAKPFWKNRWAYKYDLFSHIYNWDSNTVGKSLKYAFPVGYPMQTLCWRSDNYVHGNRSGHRATFLFGEWLPFKFFKTPSSITFLCLLCFSINIFLMEDFTQFYYLWLTTWEKNDKQRILFFWAINYGKQQPCLYIINKV